MMEGTARSLLPSLTAMSPSAVRAPQEAVVTSVLRQARSSSTAAAAPGGASAWQSHWILGFGAASAAASRRWFRVSSSQKMPVRGAAVAVRAEAQSEVSQVDFRVGEIVSAEAHPESEKLLVEQIDVGEGGPRTICSGIAKFFEPEAVVGKRVVVVSNLKERKIGGIKSNGMLLCATSGEGDDAVLDIVEAPGDAEVGERVVIEVEDGFHGDGAGPNRVQKKKLYEKVAPHLCTNDEGVVCYKDSPFNTSAGPCTAVKIPKGTVS